MTPAQDLDLALYVGGVLGTEAVVDALRASGGLGDAAESEAGPLARIALQPVIAQLETMSSAELDQVTKLLGEVVPQAIAGFVTAAPQHAAMAERATHRFRDGRVAEATAGGGNRSGLIVRIAACLGLLVGVAKLEGEVQVGGGAPAAARVALAPGVPPGLADLVEAAGRAVHGTAPSAGVPEARPPSLPRESPVATGQAPPPVTPDPAEPRPQLADEVSGDGNAAPPALPPPSRPPMRPAAAALADRFHLPERMGAPFLAFREARTIRLETALQARDTLRGYVADPAFRDIDFWWQGAVNLRGAAVAVQDARWSVGLTYVQGRTRQESGYRCVLRVQLPFHVGRPLLRKVSEQVDRELGRFVSFRWSGIVTAPSGAARRGPRRPFRIGAAVEVAGGGKGSVGLVLRDDSRFFAVTAGHVACDGSGARLKRPMAGSPTLPGESAEARTAKVTRIATFPEWRAHLKGVARTAPDIALIHLDEPSDVAEDRLGFDGRTARRAVFSPDPLSRLPQGTRIVKASGASRFQTGSVMAADVDVEIEDRSGTLRWATGLVEVLLDARQPGISLGDSGVLALVDKDGYTPLGIVVARGAAKLQDHDSPVQQVAYVQPLAHNALTKGLKVA